MTRTPYQLQSQMVPTLAGVKLWETSTQRQWNQDGHQVNLLLVLTNPDLEEFHKAISSLAVVSTRPRSGYRIHTSPGVPTKSSVAKKKVRHSSSAPRQSASHTIGLLKSFLQIIVFESSSPQKIQSLWRRNGFTRIFLLSNSGRTVCILHILIPEHYLN